MSAKIRFIHRPSGRLNRDELSEFRRFLGGVADDSARSATMRFSAQRLLAQLSRDTVSSGRWPFMLLNPERFAAISRHLRLTSVRPAVALDLLAICLRELNWETGEIVRSRFALADELGVSAQVVSRIMGELVKCGAVSRCFEDPDGHRARSVRYFFNPMVGTMLQGAARDEAQRAAPVLKLIDGGKRRSERRARASVAPLVPL
ncbi:MAG: transcriptional regulator [Microviridae sp.]|nr:MAG: transcriptional regulator [Microviridae sp.]